MSNERSLVLDAMGGEAGCLRLSRAFYRRVGEDAVLRPLFPGKSLRCAIEEFAAWLILFLDGDPEQMQFRWWLSLGESHGRFRIRAEQRAAWLRNMTAALEDDAVGLGVEVREAWGGFFRHSSTYVAGHAEGAQGRAAASAAVQELTLRWDEQRRLDDLVRAIAEGRLEESLALAPGFGKRPVVYVGILARLLRERPGQAEWERYVAAAVDADVSLAGGARRFAGRSLLHYACGAGSVAVVEALVRRHGADPNQTDKGGHTPLYAVANECSREAEGEALVRMLVSAGAKVDSTGGGVMGTTPLHMAARRGFAGIARALLDCGANPQARDRKGVTPLQRARQCRKENVARLLLLRQTAGRQ